MAPPAAAPVSPLGYYRYLSPRCGLRVSPLSLGGMSLGDAWSPMLGANTKESVFKLLDTYKAKGGNFIDLANSYQNEQSEIWVGEWLASRKCRDEMVIATKYSMGYRNHGDHKATTIQANFGGNSAKNMRASLAASLKKLQTDHIDLFYVHYYVHDTPIEEVMTYLNDLIAAGKVTYIGISDTAAWVVSKANQYARDHGMRQFIAYQGRYSPLTRDMERDIIPMCRAEGMGLVHWGVMGGGSFGEHLPNDATATDRKSAPVCSPTVLTAVREVLADIAATKGKAITRAEVALAWTLYKAPYVIPNVGMRTIERLESCERALQIQLTKEEVEKIDDANPFERGFPDGWLAPGLMHGEAMAVEDIFVTGMECWVQSVRAGAPLGAVVLPGKN